MTYNFDRSNIFPNEKEKRIAFFAFRENSTVECSDLNHLRSEISYLSDFSEYQRDFYSEYLNLDLRHLRTECLLKATITTDLFFFLFKLNTHMYWIFANVCLMLCLLCVAIYTKYLDFKNRH